MNVSEYDREIAAYLKQYQIEDLSIDKGRGGHRKCTFVYRGKRCTVTLASSPSDSDAVHIKLGDIRRLLGPPPDSDEEKEKPRRTLAAMTAELKPSNGHVSETTETTVSPSAKSPGWWSCTVALRGANKCLEFRFPPAAADAFGRDLGCSVAFTAPDLFTVRHSEEPSKFGRKSTPRINDRGRLMFGGTDILKRIGQFGSTQARCQLVGGVLQVKLTRPPSEPAAAKPTVVRRAPVPKSAPEPEEPTTKIKGVPSIADAGMEALRLIARVERESPYRLVKTTGGWEFRVPPIRLED
jgi:hypothetical protein